MLKFENSFLTLFILASFVSDCPIDGASINDRNQSCSSGEWGCENGQCILIEKRCDGEMNCSDKSDEAAKLCSTDNSGTSKHLCILPPYPYHGNYTATVGLKPGDAVPHTSLTYSCDEGYSLEGEPSPVCVTGTWVAKLPTCERQCEPLKSTSVDFKCYKQHSTVEISCDLPQDNKSRAKANCKDSYHLLPPPKDLICIEGSWDYMPYCTPECGTVSPEGKNLVINGEEAKIGEFPWHVGLYDKTSAPIRQICGGSIFSPKLVVTAAHCVYKDQAGLYPASSFAVAAGKFYRNWNAPEDDDKYVQKIDVIKIEVPDRYKGAINAFTADIAVLILEKSFVLNSFVRPVCISFDSSNNINGQLGRVAGWGLTAENGNSSQTLQTASLPVINFQDCYDNSPERFRPLVTTDKICAGYTNGTALCKGDSGGGLVFSRKIGHQNLYYLHGIVSTSARNTELDSCSAFTYTAFTNLIVHQTWFQRICLREWGCANGGCISFEQRCDGGINYCSNRIDKAEGYCSAGKLSTSKRVCLLPPYPHHGTYSATIGLKPGDAVVYTALTYSCDEGYSLKGEGSPSCVTGTWVAEVPTCEKSVEEEIPCGMLRPDGQPVVEKRITINGTEAIYMDIPWLVTMFVQKNRTQRCALADTDCWKRRCDGSLISSRVALTVSRCAYFYGLISQQKWRAGDGDNSHEPYQERFAVNTIFNPRFEDTGRVNGYKYDVALVFLESPYTPAGNIAFICLPPPSFSVPSVTCKALVRDREKEEAYGNAKVINTNHIDLNQCQTNFRNSAPPRAEVFLHESTICAETLIADGTQDILWGSSLMCIVEDHYYTGGISSWGFASNTTHGVGVYADIVNVTDWIKTKMRASNFPMEIKAGITL